MAEFCRKHCREIMGIDPDQYPEWCCEPDGICEQCGYDYKDECLQEVRKAFKSIQENFDTALGIFGAKKK